jgi:hypothetical protein
MPGVSPVAEPILGNDPIVIPPVELSGPGISAIVALIVSLSLMYIPGFQVWWDAFAYKRETLAGAGFVVALVLVGLHYIGAIDLGLGLFGWPVIWRVLEVWLSFAGTGQLVYTGQRRLARE